MKKTTTIILGSTLALLLGIGFVSADSNHPFAQQFAEKFNLDQAEVEEFMEEHREEMKQNRGEKMEEHLAELVEDGSLTENQKQALLEKREEMRPDPEEMQDLSWEEKKDLREQHREDMDVFFEENGIDPDLFQRKGPRGGMGRGLHR